VKANEDGTRTVEVKSPYAPGCGMGEILSTTCAIKSATYDRAQVKVELTFDPPGIRA
jgi:hypothetical protein